MSTSRKQKLKLAKHKRTAKKATSTEAAQTQRSTTETPPVTQRETVTARSALTGTQFVYFRHLLARPNIICITQFICLHISEPTPCPSGTQRQSTPGTSQRLQPASQKHSSGAATAGIVEHFAVCLLNSHSVMWQIFTLFFIPQGAAPRRENARPPPTLNARRRPQTATPRAPLTLPPPRARTRKILSSHTTPQKS